MSPLGGGPPADGYAPDPAERAVRTDQVGTALLVVLERLAPEQRVALVLHDVFAVPFTRVAEVLGTTEGPPDSSPPGRVGRSPRRTYPTHR
ncbi:sigma factor-like helix-turn-helix DNA-binding protein [Micromonospora sp. M12]